MNLSYLSSSLLKRFCCYPPSRVCSLSYWCKSLSVPFSLVFSGEKKRLKILSFPVQSQLTNRRSTRLRTLCQTPERCMPFCAKMAYGNAGYIELTGCYLCGARARIDERPQGSPHRAPVSWDRPCRRGTGATPGTDGKVGVTSSVDRY